MRETIVSHVSRHCGINEIARILVPRTTVVTLVELSGERIGREEIPAKM